MYIFLKYLLHILIASKYAIQLAVQHRSFSQRLSRAEVQVSGAPAEVGVRELLAQVQQLHLFLLSLLRLCVCRGVTLILIVVGRSRFFAG